MTSSTPKTAYTLSILIVILTIVASAGGLLIDGLYRDNAFVTAGWRGNDLVTLLVAVPILAVSLVYSMRGSRRAQVIWLGALDYVLYNYSFYLFGTAFNAFFVVYVALFTLSIFALIYALIRLDVGAIGGRFRPRTPARWLAGYHVLWGILLSVAWMAMWVEFVLTGHPPALIAKTDHVTNVVFALDLSMVVPPVLLSAVWLWQRRPWGYVVSGILNVKGVIYMLALIAATLSEIEAGVATLSAETGLWVFFLIASSIASALLLGNMRGEAEAARQGARRGR